MTNDRKLLYKTPREVFAFIKKHYKKKKHREIAALLNKKLPRPKAFGPWGKKHIDSICGRKKYRVKTIDYGKIPPEAFTYIKDNWQKESDRQLVISLGALIKNIYGSAYAKKIILTSKRINSIRTRMDLSKKIKPRVSVPKKMAEWLKETVATKSPKEQAYECNKKWPRGKGNGLWTGRLITAASVRLKLPKRTDEQIAVQEKRARKLGIGKSTANNRPSAPIGDIRTRNVKLEGGVIRPIKFIKTAIGFRQLTYHLWEEHNGPVPHGHHVTPVDGDWTNIVIENLKLKRQDYPAHAASNLTDNYIIGLLAAGDEDVAEALHNDGQEIVARHRRFLAMNRKVFEKTGKRKKLNYGTRQNR